MGLCYGLTNPAAFRGQFELYPDLFKFYTAVPTRSTESTAANQRRPVLYTSLNGGSGWKYESQSSDFYQANYCGNFYFDALNPNVSHGVLMALAHKSASSSYSAYKARCGVNDTIKIGQQNWETSSAVAYSTTNQPSRELCKNLSTTNQYRYFCIRNGGGLIYNDTAWSTANWTSLSLPSGTTLSDDGGFRHICINPERDHEALVLLTTNDSNKYLRFYLFDTSTNTFGTDYTSTVCYGYTTFKQASYQYCSVDYLPGVGYLIFFNYATGTKGTEVILLRTHDANTGELLPYNAYTNEGGPFTLYNNDAKLVPNGMHGWYCPWTKEYYFVPNAHQVFWTNDGLNWSSSQATPAASTAACVKFITDGTNMVVATSGSAYYYSTDKGQTWSSGTSLSPNGFNTSQSNDTIVLPFKCTNNINIGISNVTLGYWLNRTDGQPTSNAQNFYTNDYIPIDASTSYVFYGTNKTTKTIAQNNRITWYDSNKNWISTQDDTVNANIPALFTSPSNAAFARFSCRIKANTTVTQEMVDSCKWYFAKESDFVPMTEYGNIVCD